MKKISYEFLKLSVTYLRAPLRFKCSVMPQSHLCVLGLRIAAYCPNADIGTHTQ